MGEDMWPANRDLSTCDEVVAVSDAELFLKTRRLAREEAHVLAARRRARLPVEDVQRRMAGRLRSPATRQPTFRGPRSARSGWRSCQPRRSGPRRSRRAL